MTEIFCRGMVFKFWLAKFDYCFVRKSYIQERFDLFLWKMHLPCFYFIAYNMEVWTGERFVKQKKGNTTIMCKIYWKFTRLQILIWSKNLTLLFDHFQQDNYEIEFLTGKLDSSFFHFFSTDEFPNFLRS